MKRLSTTLLLFGLLFAAGESYAQPRRISPGHLSLPHESLEGMDNCTKCHELGKGISEANCLTCHTSIAVRIDEKRGLHASAEHMEKGCTKCHSEHHGKEYKLVYWPEGEKQFDHSLAGYRLLDRHAGLECVRCHQSAFIRDEGVRADKYVNMKTTRLGLSQSCVACHNDEHGEQLSDNCLDCHDYKGWTPAPGFDHQKAKYALAGKHKDVSCEKCHPSQNVPVPQFPEALKKKENVGKQSDYELAGRFPGCTPCHKDPHDGRFKGACSTCHQTSGWTNILEGKTFDHDQTAYPLRGKHTSVDCVKCHKSGKRTDPLAHEHCTDCHADEHRGQFARRPDGIGCETCHMVEGFIPALFTVSQHAKGRYPLQGSHLAVPCNLCHVKIHGRDGGEYARFTFDKLTCDGCHKDVHEGRLDRWVKEGGCELCHNVETWHTTSFDHNRTDWKLTGKHREGPCLSCHKEVEVASGQEKIWFKPLSTECSFCHTDIHQGQFVRPEMKETAAKCDRCHKTTGWTGDELVFDHETDSRFTLKGAHKNVKCVDCHPNEAGEMDAVFVRYRPLGRECADCHLPDWLKKQNSRG